MYARRPATGQEDTGSAPVSVRPLQGFQCRTGGRADRGNPDQTQPEGMTDPLHSKPESKTSNTLDHYISCGLANPTLGLAQEIRVVAP